MKLQRQYRPVKVKDPQTQGHAVRLQARQTFLLILSGLEKKNCVKINSEFIDINEICYDYERNLVQYTLVQKYDLTEWTYISNVFLGNIEVAREEDKPISLCVYLDCCNFKKYSVLTIINPKNHTVKIDPHQLIQVAIWTPVDHPYTNWSASYNQAMLEEVKSETVINDVCHLYDRNEVFCCEPRAINHIGNNKLNVPNSDIKTPEKKIIEHHYWYRIKRDQLEKVSDYDNGCYNVGRLTFRHFNNPGSSQTSFDVIVSLRNSTREKIDLLLYDAITTRINDWNKRTCDPYSQLLLNPNVCENIDIKSGQDFFYIELPQPSVYFNCFHDNVFWQAEVGDNLPFQVTELESRLINGKYVQRFFIKNIIPSGETVSPETYKDFPFIGHVKFVCRKNIECGGKIVRTINMNFWRKPIGLNASVRKVSLPVCVAEQLVCQDNYITSGSYSKNASNSIVLKKTDDELIVSEVELEQIYDVDLNSDAILIRLGAVQCYSKCQNSDTHSYYWTNRKKKLGSDNDMRLSHWSDHNLA